MNQTLFWQAKNAAENAIEKGGISSLDFVFAFNGCSQLDGVYHKITNIEGSVIYELDDNPIVDRIDEFYGNQDWRHQNPIDFITIGINFGGRFEEPKELKLC